MRGKRERGCEPTVDLVSCVLADIVCNKKLLTVQMGAFDAYARSWNVILRSCLLLWKLKGGARKRMGGVNGLEKRK